jgi:hypothetical protein
LFAGLAERDVPAREKLDELKSMRVPGEDPEAGDEGLAWPEREARRREAILQPPKPEIRRSAAAGRDARVTGLGRGLSDALKRPR